jgi:hypothetical protein
MLNAICIKHSALITVPQPHDTIVFAVFEEARLLRSMLQVAAQLAAASAAKVVFLSIHNLVWSVA